jgi:hypothetical protein
MSDFITINAAARRTGIPASRIRAMVKRGECPGFFSGSRFYVDSQRFERVFAEAVERSASDGYKRF